ncbi:choline transporter-like protein [Anaeramoeba flamelloides]|uniref:Choline transporter-like protein n=1 Tax=Anaeramoeba flamelloides TaxID=1746091 RepID=A0ABQ8XEI3_9EUKA|nr:choline transporter-like protein [Anaeramoeba flamelloides]
MFTSTSSSSSDAESKKIIKKYQEQDGEWADYQPYEEEEAERFSTPKWRDTRAIFALLAVVVAFFVVAFTLTIPENDTGNEDASADTEPTYETKFESISNGYWASVFIALSGISLVFAFIWIKIMERYGAELMNFILIAEILAFAIFSIICLLYKQYVLGGILIFCTVLCLLLYYMWRSRIPLAAAMLTAVTKVTRKYSAMSMVALLFGVIVQIAWIMAWSLAAIRAFQIEKNWWTFMCILCYYWIQEVILNIIHVTCASVYGQVFFLNDEMPENPTASAFKKAITYSFGSICLGSFNVALIRTLKRMARMVKGNYAVKILIFGFIACLEWITEYFNAYALVHVAVYGKSYMKCAKATVRLLKDRGIYALVNDDLVGDVLVMGALISGIIVAIVGFFWAKIAFDSDLTCMVVFTLIGLFVGIFLTLTVFSVISSGVMTYYVLFAEAPGALKHSDPELYNKIVETYNGKYRKD